MLAGGCLVVILSSVTTLALASHRIQAEDAAFDIPATGRCVPEKLDVSDVLPGTPLEVSPLPDSFDASDQTQISMLGVPARDISDIKVTGSVTGGHGGTLKPYSQGDGASFVPSSPFHAGETVTVRGNLSISGKKTSFAYHFDVNTEDVLPYAKPGAYKGSTSELQRFHTRPELDPPITTVSATSSSATPGLIFAAPYNGAGSSGPMIFNEAGELVWFDPLPHGVESTNLQVQQLGGQPVLTWWQGYIPPQGFGEGEEIVYNTAYQKVTTVKAGNGYKADLHDFHLEPNGTAVLTVFNPIRCDLSSSGGPSGGAVTDALFQEIDVHTGLVRREWTSVDHVALSESHSVAVSTSLQWPFDFFHINSIDEQSNGTTLISARNTWTLYELNSTTGQVLNRIGGRNSTIKQEAGAVTAYQHDATVLPDGDITVFDNGAVPTIHKQSRALVLSVNTADHTEALVTEYEHHPAALSAGSQGDVQALEDGNIFVGWGAEPYFSEYNPAGETLFDAHWPGTYQSYRAYRFAWTGEPTTPPVAKASLSGSRATVWVSWNGDTRTTAWRLLGGSSKTSLSELAKVEKKGFETTIAAAAAKYFQVQALDAEGAVIGTSAVISG